MAIGKWHNTKEHNARAAGEKSSWPVQRGFDRFYGFIASETSFIHPDCLYEGSQTVDIDAYPADHFATDDWTNRAIRWTKAHLGAGPLKPFLLYLAFNAPHAPIQARPRDIAKYKGRYDLGWDVLRERRWRKQIETGILAADTKLSPRNPGIPAWNGAGVHAGYASFADGIGTGSIGANHSDHSSGLIFRRLFCQTWPGAIARSPTGARPEVGSVRSTTQCDGDPLKQLLAGQASG